MKIGVNNGGNVILLAFPSKQSIRKNGKCCGLVKVEPVVADWGQDVHDEHKADCNIGSGKPWAGKWAAQVGGDGGPVESNGAEAQPIKARTNLLG